MGLQIILEWSIYFFILTFVLLCFAKEIPTFTLILKNILNYFGCSDISALLVFICLILDNCWTCPISDHYLHQCVSLNIDVVSNNILLLSRKTIETTNMTIDLKNDIAVIFGEPEPLFVTKSGHYAIRISPYRKILNNVTNGSNSNVTIIATTDRSTQETALTLHRQLSHPWP